MIAEADISHLRAAADSSAFVAASPAADAPSSHPTSDIPLPTSSPPPRRAVPTTFNPIINDEANILAAIARGDRTLPDLAEEHATTVSALCLWIQREDIQKKLADLTTCGATLTRIAAVNQLPKAVSALSFQIDGYIFDRTHNLIKPGLDADRVAATRDANVRKAAHLMLRLARFDPNQPVYRKRARGIELGGAVDDAAKRHAPPAPTTDELLQTVLNAPAFTLGAVPVPTTSSDLSARRGRAGEPLVPLPLADHKADGSQEKPWSAAPTPICTLQSNPETRFPAEAPDHKHNGHTNGRLIRGDNPPDPAPRSRPPPFG